MTASEQPGAEAEAQSEQHRPPLAIRERLEWLRTGPYAEVVTAITFILAIPIGTVHWVGLVLAGALVGLVAPSLRRALVMGLYLGGAFVVVFVLSLTISGVFSKAIATGQLLGLSVVLSLLFPLLGSSVRGLI